MSIYQVRINFNLPRKPRLRRKLISNLPTIIWQAKRGRAGKQIFNLPTWPRKTLIFNLPRSICQTKRGRAEPGRCFQFTKRVRISIYPSKVGFFNLRSQHEFSIYQTTAVFQFANAQIFNLPTHSVYQIRFQH